MYEDNVKVSINWKSLILKVVLVVVFVLLIIWLFPMPKLDVFYNKVYNENLTTMKEASEKYFVGDKLPETTGNSVTLKLQDMLDKKLITTFVDKDNNQCSNTNSFAQVTKTENDTYVLKVQLACNEKTDYILENISTTATITNVINKTDCENCSNNSNSSSSKSTSSSSNSEDDGIEIDEKILTEADSKYDKDIATKEYQYKRAITKTNTTYACPSGYVKENNVCYRYNTEETIAATPVYFSDTTVEKDAKQNVSGAYTQYAESIKTVQNTEKMCHEGYTLNGNICYKYVSATVVPGSTSYTCPDGYTLNGKKCTQTISATGNNGSGYYTCPSGYTLNGTMCTQTISATKNTSNGDKYYTCDKGGYLDGKKCYYSASYQNGSTSCKCPSGYSESGGSCVKKVSYTGTYHAGSTSYGNCPSGYSASGSYCVKTYTASASISWSNPTVRTSSTPLSVYSNATSKRVLANKSCTLKGCTYTYYEYTAKTSYSCPSGGSLSGTTCKITTSRPTTTSSGYYTCNDGSKQSSSTCYKYDYKSKDCSTSSGKYYCPNGGSLSGSQCKYDAKEHTGSGSTYYSCPSGYSLNGTNCTKTINATYNGGGTSYSCPAGYTLNGTNCTREIDATEKVSETTYSCPVGYVKEGTTCYQYTEPTTKINYNYTCPDGYTKSGDKEYTKCSKTVESKTSYYCESADEELVGTKCRKVVKGALKGYTCPDGYLLNRDQCVKKTIECTEPEEITNTSVTYEYKWSTDPNLEGWTPTGKTRTSETTTTVDNSSKYEK